MIFKVMHALGWWHEQQRGDRDEHVKVWADRCYWNEATFNVNQGKLSSSRWQDQNSPYDTASIMHYNTNSCASGADPVITKPDGSPLILSKGSSLSKQDILLPLKQWILLYHTEVRIKSRKTSLLIKCSGRKPQ